MAMSQTRISVEWLFNKIKIYFKFVSLKSRVKIDRSSQRRCSVRKGVLRNFTKFTEIHLRQSLFFNKVARPQPCNFIKKEARLQVFSCNFAKFLRTPFLQITFVCLHLDGIKCSWQNLLCMCLASKCRNMFIIWDMGIKFLSFSSSFA